MALTKSDIVAKVHELGFTKKKSVDTIEALLEIIKGTIGVGGVSGIINFRLPAKEYLCSFGILIHLFDEIAAVVTHAAVFIDCNPELGDGKTLIGVVGQDLIDFTANIVDGVIPVEDTDFSLFNIGRRHIVELVHQ